MTTGTYDPFALDKPVLRLGDHGEWHLGDITEGRQTKLTELIKQFGEAASGENLKVSTAADLVGQLCEIACIKGDGLRALIVDLCDEEKHGEEALGVRALGGFVTFVVDWMNGERLAGEG